ncbi:MAG: MBL fold metallo-hydrolase [Spirochaetia bacterium]
MSTIQFLGAARNVTGSRYLIEHEGKKILIDCGMFQERDFRSRNWDPFPVPPKEIDAVLLTHAHLDHCGYLPRLVKEGYANPVYCIAAGIDIVKIVLLDSGHIQEEDAEKKAERHRREGRTGPHGDKPLYTQEDGANVFPLFKPVEFGKPFEPVPGIRAEYREAGHILASAMIKITLPEQDGSGKTIVFSGDLGRFDKPILRDPEAFSGADYLVTESTYGDRDHEDPKDIHGMLEDIINDTVRRGGNVVIPSFAIGRTQEVLYYLNELLLQDRIPHLLTFLDSPMAIKVTDVFRDHQELYDKEMRKLVEDRNSPFTLPSLKYTSSVSESKMINHIKGTAVIIAGSGMCTGGRIKHHLIHNIGRKDSTILFVGYQAKGTLGREIADRNEKVRILGTRFSVKARIAQIHGFSAHAGREELLDWYGRVTENGPVKKVFICHGEEDASLSFADALRNRGAGETVVPEYQDRFSL